MDGTKLVLIGLCLGIVIVASNAQFDTPVDTPGNPTDAPADTPGASDVGGWTVDDIMTPVRAIFGGWRPPAKYAATIAATEVSNGIPTDVLARLLYQECRWREDIITGVTTSPAGALGIAQFMPATARDMGIDPLNWAQAIPAAGRYLARLYRSLGTWTKALAAYNWGIGNVQRQGLTRAPTETTNYYTQILGDVNSSNGTNYA